MPISKGYLRAFRNNDVCTCPGRRMGKFCVICTKRGARQMKVYSGTCGNCRILLEPKYSRAIIDRCMQRHISLTCPLGACGICGDYDHRSTQRNPCREELNWCINCFNSKHKTYECPFSCHQCGSSHPIKASITCMRSVVKSSTINPNHNFYVGVKIYRSGGYGYVYNQFAIITEMSVSGNKFKARICDTIATQLDLTVNLGKQRPNWLFLGEETIFVVTKRDKARECPRNFLHKSWRILSAEQEREGLIWKDDN